MISIFVSGVMIGKAAGQQRPSGVPTPAQPELRLDQQGLEPQPSSPAPLILELPATRLPPEANAIRFVLKKFDIEGVTAYPPAEIEEFYKPLIGKEVSLAELYQVRADIEKKYHEDGYFLTRVIVPAQTITDGKFRLQVVEGYIDGIEFDGSLGPVESLVRSYLENVVNEHPLNIHDFERYLLLANDIPGVSVQGILRASPDNVGAARLIARSSRKPVDAFGVFDNYGDEYTGVLELAGRVAGNSFTPAGEQLSITALGTDPFNGFDNGNNNEWTVQVGSSWRYGWEGLYSEASFAYGNSHPGFVVKDSNFDINSYLFNIDVGLPVIRSRELTLTTLVGFQYYASDTDVFGGEKFSRDRVPKIYFSVEGEANDAWRGNSNMTLTLSQGLGVLGATTEGDTYASIPGGTAVATIFIGEVSRDQPIFEPFDVLGQPASFSLFGSLSGQYAFDRLLQDDLFDIGGSTIYGRGYDYGELSGDNGIAFTGEVRFDQPLNLRYLNHYQLFGFYDVGEVWFRKGSADTGSGNSLSSAGGGVRANFTSHVYGEFQIAKPLTLDSERSSFGRDPQFLFRVVTRL